MKLTRNQKKGGNGSITFMPAFYYEHHRCTASMQHMLYDLVHDIRKNCDKRRANASYQLPASACLVFILRLMLSVATDGHVIQQDDSWGAGVGAWGPPLKRVLPLCNYSSS